MTTESEVFAAVRSFILRVLGDGTRVVQGQMNSVAPPKDASYIVFWATQQTALATNVPTYNVLGGVRELRRSTQWRIDLNVYGVEASSMAQSISIAFRDAFAYDFFASLGTGVAPLYGDDPQQMAFLTPEKTYQNRYVMALYVQIVPSISTTQEFADTLTPNFIEVDAEYA